MARLSGFALLVAALGGCAASVDDGGLEEAAANAAPLGKLDGTNFVPGWYQTASIDHEANEPLTAILRDDGTLDFTRFVDASTTEYATGTYKIYTYAGHDRIRLTRDDGSELLRSDWFRATDGTLTFANEDWYRPDERPDDLVHCLAMQVMAPDEGLSVVESPDVSFEQHGSAYALDLGGTRFDSTDATFKIADKPGETVVTATLPTGEIYGLRVPKTEPRRGAVFFLTDAAANEQTIAKVVCR